MDFYVWEAMLQMYEQYVPKPTNKDELKEVLEEIWEELLQQNNSKVVLSFRKRLLLRVELKEATLNIFSNSPPL
jgi:YesN/AraC family two-component response regulator